MQWYSQEIFEIHSWYFGWSIFLGFITLCVTGWHKENFSVNQWSPQHVFSFRWEKTFSLITLPLSKFKALTLRALFMAVRLHKGYKSVEISQENTAIIHAQGWARLCRLGWKYLRWVRKFSQRPGGVCAYLVFRHGFSGSLKFIPINAYTLGDFLSTERK